MRILATADIYGNQAIYRWLSETVEETRPTAVVLAGDVLEELPGHLSIEDAQDADTVEVLAILGEIDVPIFFIMGNDDMVELNPVKTSVQSIHGRRIAMGDYNFVGYQYSLPFMGGIHEKPEEKIHLDLKKLADLVDQRTVLATHSPAYGILDVGIMDVHAGSTSILNLVKSREPVAHILGHIHSAFGRQGRHFNVAADGRKRAVLIDLIEMTHEVIVGQARS